ncbi:glycosyltransferase family 4 protein [Trinickia violacea]|uniref:Glycosyltransferase family 4 protein n=1 Tax=Trinickia violacea TaxID=2571746 RepID=A0A4P8ISW8_9BURK|nr:glycosyltransferase family 4 protein [Trinickia violacea]QCP50855.1 glycosyltransferase family 4 protein [Trinickia violacea]
MRVLFVIGNLGDYHVPRYQALDRVASQRGIDLSLVEIFGTSKAYAYPQPYRGQFFSTKPQHCVTLLEDAAEGDAHWLRVGAKLAPIVRRTVPDCVVTLGYNTSYSLYLCLLKLLTRRYKLVYMSDSKADDGKRYMLKERAKRFLVSQFDGALVAGEKHRAYAESLGVPLERSRIGFDVIDVGYIRDAAQQARQEAPRVRGRYGLPSRYVLCVARFVPRKNVDIVVDAYAASGLAASGVALVLVGQGPRGDALAAQIARLGLASHVTILPAVPNRDMPGIYALADFVMLASAFDQWGLCINEALAAGCPVIVTRTCGVANEMVRDNVNGFIIEPGSAARLAERMQQLGGSPALRERLAAHAFAGVREWTPDLFAENLFDLAESLTAPEPAVSHQASR